MMNKHKISTVVLFILILIGVAGAVVVNIDGSALVAKTNLTTCIGNNATQWNGTVGNCILTSSGGVTNDTVNPYSFNASNATGTLPNTSAPLNSMNFSSIIGIGSVKPSSNQLNIPHGVYTFIPMQTKNFDPNNNFDSNGNYTVPVSGYYQVNVQLYWTSTISTSQYYLQVYKNNANLFGGVNSQPASANEANPQLSKLIHFNVNDKVNIYGYTDVGDASDLFAGNTYLDIYLVRKD